jgi:hypothetical protein
MGQPIDKPDRKKPRFVLIEEPVYADYVDPNAGSISLDEIPYQGLIPPERWASIVSEVNGLFYPSRELECRVLFSEGRRDIEFIATPPLSKEDLFYIRDIVRRVVTASLGAAE